MKIIAVIPSRYEASRFPGKLVQDLCGKSVIERTYEVTAASGLFDEVIVATDSDIIARKIILSGGKVYMSKCQHETGSDRIAEAVEHLEADIVINVQGDEPFTNTNDLMRLIEVFQNDTLHEISLASLMHKLTKEEALADPNNVKVITDKNGYAIYFSRSAIPFNRDKEYNIPVFKHIGIYAFRKKALLDFYTSEPTPLELKEKIECLRYLENGKRIKMLTTNKASIGIDTPQDLNDARKLWKRLNY